MNRRVVLALVAAVLGLTACGGSESVPSTTPRPDTITAEVSFGGPDAIADPGPTPEAAGDADDDAPADVPVIPDGADDLAVPDAPDDVSACGTCPVDRPRCVAGSCECDADSCAAGSWCNGGACTPCDVVDHCGAACLDCAAEGTPFCQQGQCRCSTDAHCGEGHWCDAGTCAECADDDPLHCGSTCAVCTTAPKICSGGLCHCTVDAECGVAYRCVAGGCEPCNTPVQCGATCSACPAATPVCYQLACICNAGSCPSDQWCDGAACAPCSDDDPLHCGASCAACPGGSPVCQGGSCVCTADAQCGAGAWCDAGTCTPCGEADPAHCGASCAVCDGATPACAGGRCGCTSTSCGAGAFCDATGTCHACTTNDHCGPGCAPCPADNPVCAGDTCVSCLTDPQCSAGSWCQSGQCVPCGDADPLHCGATCTVCGGTTPTCQGGACTCEGASCGSGHVCEGGTCQLCNADQRCGSDCTPCGAPTPYCTADGKGCVACLDDSHCAAADHCANGACVPDCVAQGCESNDAPDAKKCSTAKIVGREQASIWRVYTGDTTSMGSDDDLPTTLFDPGPDDCWDANNDAMYRIYLVAGDTLTAKLQQGGSDYDLMLKLYTGTACDDNKWADLIDCWDDNAGSYKEQLDHTATADGWYTIVVDGRSGPSDDYGPYTLTVSLACKFSNCCCP